MVAGDANIFIGITFRRLLVQAAGETITAVNAAAVWLNARTDADSDAAGTYFAFQQAADAYGLPPVDWSGVTAAQVGNFRKMLPPCAK